MAWEDDYEEDEYGEFDPYEDLHDLEDYEEYITELSQNIIHVDIKELSDQICRILENFHEKFGYGLQPEIESKTFFVSIERGYLAAHFTPTKFNRTQKYYTLYYNKNYKSYPDAFQYSVDFTDGFFDNEGKENDDADVDTIAQANNIESIIESILGHWKVEE